VRVLLGRGCAFFGPWHTPLTALGIQNPIRPPPCVASPEGDPSVGALWDDQNDKATPRQREIATRIDLLRQMQRKVAAHHDAPAFAHNSVALCRRELVRICALTDTAFEHEPPRFNGWSCSNMAPV
jgi:hypothetical protein